MDLAGGNPGLREAMEEGSILSEIEPNAARARELIVRGLSTVLRQGERVIAYADRDLYADQADVLAGNTGRAALVPDVMGYTPGGPRDQTDVFARFEETGRTTPDVLGYRPAGSQDQTDALFYDRPAETPLNDALMAGGPVTPPDVDFLVLTESRLVRGSIEGGEVSFNEAPCAEPEIQMLSGTHLAVRLPEAVRRSGEGDRWHWRVPENADVTEVAARWRRQA